MGKNKISISIEEETKEAVKKVAEQEKRSFSQMVDILLTFGLEVFKKTKNKK